MPSENWSEANGVTANLTWRMGDLEIVSITDYSYFEWRVGATLVGGENFDLANDTYAKGIDQWSQEVRISADYEEFRWVVGVYALSIESDNGFAFGYLPGTGIPEPVDQLFNFEQETGSLSVFGQLEWDLTPEFTAIVGLRGIREEKEYDFRSTLTGESGTEYAELRVFNPDTSDLADQEADLWSAKLGLNWTPAEDTLFYGTINRGVKAGGFNNPTTPVGFPDENFYFEPEELVAYELGFKKSALGNRVTVNGAAYYYDYQSYQAYQNEQLLNFLFNLDAEVYGAELELVARPMEGLDLLLGAAYVDATAKDVPVNPALTTDRQIPFSPQWNLNALVRYEWP